VLTGALAADSSRVRLRRPGPSARALRLERPGPGDVELHDDAGLLADGVDADILAEVHEPVAPAEALAASRSLPARHITRSPLSLLRPRASARPARVSRTGERTHARDRAPDAAVSRSRSATEMRGARLTSRARATGP
jgi:hypothetical protein